MGALARIGVKYFSIDKAALAFMEQIMLSIYEGVYLSLGDIGDFQLFVSVPGIGIVPVFIIVYVISTWEGGISVLHAFKLIIQYAQRMALFVLGIIFFHEYLLYILIKWRFYYILYRIIYRSKKKCLLYLTEYEITGGKKWQQYF